MNRVLNAIDTMSEHTGRTIAWLAVLLVLVLAYEATARFVFDAPTIWAHQFATMVGATIASLGWAYTLRHNAHVRVDIVYSNLSKKWQAGIDAFFTAFFFFPLLGTSVVVAAKWMERSWRMGETFTESFWYPPAGPLRTLVFIGLLLFLLQGFALFWRALQVLAERRSS